MAESYNSVQTTDMTEHPVSSENTLQFLKGAFLETKDEVRPFFNVAPIIAINTLLLHHYCY